jgi:iron complex transport system substrate-binding protein
MLTRFRFVCFAFLSLILAACGGSIEAKPLVVLDESATTRTIEHTFGVSEVPAQPERVLALGEEGLLADLLDIGIRPVASIVNLPEYLPPLFSAEELQGIELLSSTTNVSVEHLAELNPDLIIGSAFFIDRVGYERLAEIAPTIAIGGTNELENYAQTLAAFGLAGRAQADLAAFDAELQTARAQLSAGNPSVSVAAIYPGSSVAVFTDHPRTAPWLLRQLGLTLRPDGSEEGLSVTDGRAFISLERLDLLSGEHLILLQNESVEGEAESVAETTANPLWQLIPAVQAGKVTTLDRLGYPGFRGVKLLLDDLVEILE